MRFVLCRSWATKTAGIVFYYKAFATKEDARVSAIKRDEVKLNNIYF